MLKTLGEVVGILPDLLLDSERWKSLLIDYEPPTVERVYTDITGIRVSLHVIQPCKADEPFFHPHPWPSAIKILSGQYEMKVGFGSGIETPPVLGTIVLTAGSVYEMTHPDGWHSVRPIEFPSRSIMVSGPSWNREMPKTPQRKLNPLSNARKAGILRDFSELLGLREY